MHAVVVRISIGDAEIAEQEVREKVVPAISNAPDFVAGYWTRSEEGSDALSILVFDSEAAARAVGDRFRSGTNVPETGSVSRLEIREVFASA